jgi:hypothetical protein
LRPTALSAAPAPPEPTDGEQPVITHVVTFTFADKANAAECVDRLNALEPQIDAIRTWFVGADSVGDPGAADVVLVSTHDDLDGLRAYQQHPVHEEFAAWVRPLLADKSVVDVAS